MVLPKLIKKKMKNFKISCARFALYVYENYIYEDFDVLTKLGKIVTYPAWFIRSIFVWLVCPVFLPEYWFKNSELYKEIQKIQKSQDFANVFNR